MNTKCRSGCALPSCPLFHNPGTSCRQPAAGPYSECNTAASACLNQSTNANRDRGIVTTGALNKQTAATEKSVIHLPEGQSFQYTTLPFGACLSKILKQLLDRLTGNMLAANRARQMFLCQCICMCLCLCMCMCMCMCMCSNQLHTQ